ncbi:uncharacterized protein LOC135153830 [Lytechinus pictus]|uniref:uncharacterized protein LOC135153830 n=1 Tax=Lytechinus pictus TaxID=7653 RepID=UPI0030B9FDBB
MAPKKSRKKRKNQPDEEEGPQPIPVAEEKATASVIAGDEGDEFGEAQTEDDEMLQEGGQDPPAAASDENNVTDGHATCGITKAMEQELVEFFADNEFIYDKSKVDFKNSKKKERKYMEMAEKLGVTVADIRLWYKSQRTILGKMKTAGKKSGQKAIVLTPRQRWVNNNLGFLTKHIVHRSQGCQLGHLSGRITEAASDEEGLDEEGPDGSQAPSSNQVSSQGAAPPKKRQKRGSPTDVDKALLEFIRTSTEQTAIRSQVDAALTQGADERQAWLEWMLQAVRPLPRPLWREFTRDTFNLVSRYQDRADHLSTTPVSRPSTPQMIQPLRPQSTPIGFTQDAPPASFLGMLGPSSTWTPQNPQGGFQQPN